MPTPGVCPLSRLDDPIDITVDVAYLTHLSPSFLQHRLRTLFWSYRVDHRTRVRFY